MKLKKIGNNVTEMIDINSLRVMDINSLRMIDINSLRVMFSYETPVAGYCEQGAFRTDEKFSVTTSKHINKYLGGKDVGKVVPQAWIEGLVT